MSSINTKNNYEFERLKTFNRWSNSNVSVRKLALCGFYFYGDIDIVKCYYCGIEIDEFTANDEPLKLHKKWAPNCPLLTNKNSNNQPLDKKLFDKYIEEGEYLPFEETEEELDLIDFSIKSNRVNSFKSWPKNLQELLDNLVNAGFYYLGVKDYVRCYACNGGLKNWKNTDIPWDEHVLWYGEQCFLVQLRNNQLNKE